jgi:hypothetical protein
MWPEELGKGLTVANGGAAMRITDGEAFPAMAKGGSARARSVKSRWTQ